MSTAEKIRRHGALLTRLTLLALVVMALYTTWLAYVPWLPADLQAPSILQRYFALRVAEPQALPDSVRAMLSLAGIALGLSWLLPLWMLYRLGDRLRRDNALNADTAVAVRHLAHSIIVGLLLLQGLSGFLTGLTIAAVNYTGGEMQQIYTDLHSGKAAVEGLADLFLPLVACLCLYSLSWLIRTGAEAADEVRSIV